MYLNVKDHPNLKRDSNSGAVFVSKDHEYENFKKQKTREQNLRNEVNTLKQENVEINQKLDVILGLLRDKL